jgi:hypothetical protein
MGVRILSSLILAVGLSFSFAQENAKSASHQAELESKFKELLTDCVFDGHWCMVNDGTLSEEKAEKYTITGATKSGGEVWLIYAKMQYRGKEVSVPVPVQVKWAGDTPVITLDKVTIPGMGTYSARVLLFEKTYAGSWSAGNHGGMLHGLVQKKEKKTE